LTTSGKNTKKHVHSIFLHTSRCSPFPKFSLRFLLPSLPLQQTRLLHPTASTAAPFFLSSDSHTAVPTDPQLLPAPRKHFLLLLSAAVRLHQQLPATPGETHTCSSSSQLPSHFSSASGASPHFNRSFSPSVSSTATERRQQATSPSPSTNAHRPAAPWSSDRPLEEEETGSAVKQIQP